MPKKMQIIKEKNGGDEMSTFALKPNTCLEIWPWVNVNAISLFQTFFKVL